MAQHTVRRAKPWQIFQDCIRNQAEKAITSNPIVRCICPWPLLQLLLPGFCPEFLSLSPSEKESSVEIQVKEMMCSQVAFVHSVLTANTHFDMVSFEVLLLVCCVLASTGT